MDQFDIGPTPIRCANCKKEIMIKLSDLKKGNIITCKHCGFKMQVKDNYAKQVNDSLRDLKKTISDTQKKINKAFK